jgi:hypothetical protein
MVVAAVAVLNFAVATGAQPRLVSDGPLMPERAEDWRNDPRETRIHDARQTATTPGLDDAGFCLVRRRGDGADRRGVDASHDEPIRRACFSEAEAIAGASTGARRAIAFDWTHRTKDPPAPDNTAVGAPVLRVHNDFTPRSSEETLRQLLGVVTPAGAGWRTVDRYAIVSVWWPIRPVKSWPLALADARTIDDNDLIVVERHYPNVRGEVGFLAYRATQRWFTFPAILQAVRLVARCGAMGAAQRIPRPVGARWGPSAQERRGAGVAAVLSGRFRQYP